MSPTILSALRTYFRILARLAPHAAGRQAYQLFRTPRRRAPVPSTAVPVMARAERLAVEAVGQRVAAYRWRARNGSCAASRVILVHGWESRAARLAVWVDPLLAAGFEVVAFDAPAHGDSTGRRADPFSFVEAMRAVIDRAGPVSFAVGHSLGGLSAVLAVAGGRLFDRQGLALERLVVIAGAESGVDAMAMFCRVLGLGDGFLPLLLDGAAEAAGHPIPEFDAHRRFGEFPIPTLWLHDPQDRDVPFEGAQRVALACPHVTLDRVAGLGHHRIARDPSIIARSIEFLDADRQKLTGAPKAA